VPANLQLCAGSTVECRHIYNGKLQSRSIGTSVTHRPPESKSNAVYQSLLISNSIRIIPQNKSRQRGGKSINFVAKLGNRQRPSSLQVSVRCAYRASHTSRPTLSLSHTLSVLLSRIRADPRSPPGGRVEILPSRLTPDDLA